MQSYRRCKGLVTNRLSRYVGEEKEGFFLGWGIDCCEDGSFTVALIELGGGSVATVLPENLTFLDRLSDKKVIKGDTILL